MSEVDVVSGSMAYNRFEMQLSQSILFAIELYDSSDFLITLDYYDDISIFDDSQMQGCVSYYQMKTNESITLTYVLKDDWISKLYTHLEEPRNIDTLGIIMSSPLKNNNKKIFEKGTKRLESFEGDIVSKIKQDLAKKTKCKIEEIDLSKFVFVRTILSIDSHREYVQTALVNMLSRIDPDISIRTLDTVFKTLVDILTRKQSFELTSNSSEEDIIKYKSFSKKEMNSIVEFASRITLPDFTELMRPGGLDPKAESRIGMAYAYIISDSRANKPSFYNLLDIVVQCIQNSEISGKPHEIMQKVRKKVSEIDPFNIHVMADDFYVETLALCVLVKGGV